MQDESDQGSSEKFIVWTFLNDFKQSSWQRGSGGRLRFQTVGRVEAIRALVKFRKPKISCLLFRYLNDKRRLLKTVYLLFSESLLICLCRIRKIPIVWICHNVDQESNVFWPIISRLRRRQVISAAGAVCVTIDELVERFRALNPKYSRDVTVSTFGVKCNVVSCASNLKEGRFRTQFGIAQESIAVLSIGGWLQKKRHEVERVTFYAKLADERGLDLKFIVAGTQCAGLKQCEPKLYEELAKLKNVHILNKFVPIDQCFDANGCDFLFKSYPDYSVPYGVFDALRLNVPIVSEAKTFVGEVVERRGIGMNLSSESLEVDFLRLTQIREDPSLVEQGIKEFLRANTWERGASAIGHAIRCATDRV